MTHPDDHARVLALDEESTRTGEPFMAEYRVLRTDGSIAWVRAEAALVRDPDGQPAYWQGVMVDITEQKEAELQLQEAEKRVPRRGPAHPGRDLHATPWDPRIPHAHQAVYVSPQVETMFGYSVANWLGELDGWRNAIHPEDRKRIVADDVQANATGKTFREEYRVVTKDGSRDVGPRRERGRPRRRGAACRFWQGVMFDVTDASGGARAPAVGAAASARPGSASARSTR